MELKRFNNLEDVEFEVFKEINSNIGGIDTSVTSKFEGFIDRRGGNLSKVIKIIGNKVICYWCNDYSKEYFVFENLFNLKENDIILTLPNDKDELKNVLKVEEDVCNYDFLNEYAEKVYEIPIEAIEQEKILTKEIIKNIINKTLENRKKEEKIKKELEEGEKEKEEEDKEKLIETFEKESIGEFRQDVKVNKNKLTKYSDRYVFKRNISKIFDYNFLDKTRYDGYILNWIEDYLIQKEENYTKQEKENNKWVNLYNIQFKRNTKKEILKSLGDKKYYPEIKINGVKVNKAKIKFILNKINKNTPKKEIELMNKLTGMKIDCLELKEIRVYRNKKYISMDINISLDGNNFKIEFMDITQKVDWDFLKKHLFSGGSSRIIYSELRKKHLMSFVEDLGFTKQQFYDYLKRLVMLKELKK